MEDFKEFFKALAYIAVIAVVGCNLFWLATTNTWLDNSDKALRDMQKTCVAYRHYVDKSDAQRHYDAFMKECIADIGKKYKCDVEAAKLGASDW